MEVGSGVSLWMKSQKYLYCVERGGAWTGAGVSLQVAIAGWPPVDRQIRLKTLPSLADRNNIVLEEGISLQFNISFGKMS